jgi:hypothetical protein
LNDLDRSDPFRFGRETRDQPMPQDRRGNGFHVIDVG